MNDVWERAVKCAAALGGAIAGWFGGWSALMTALAVMMAMDYLTGCMAAFAGRSTKTQGGGWLSQESFKGLMRKGAIMLMVLLGTMLDRAVGTDGMVFQTATACYYIANEGLSVLENVARLGVPVPAAVRRALEALKEKGDGGGDDEER